MGSEIILQMRNRFGGHSVASERTSVEHTSKAEGRPLLKCVVRKRPYRLSAALYTHTHSRPYLICLSEGTARLSLIEKLVPCTAKLRVLNLELAIVSGQFAIAPGNCIVLA